MWCRTDVLMKGHRNISSGPRELSVPAESRRFDITVPLFQWGFIHLGFPPSSSSDSTALNTHFIPQTVGIFFICSRVLHATLPTLKEKKKGVTD